VIKPKATDSDPARSLRDGLYPILKAASQARPNAIRHESRKKTASAPPPAALRTPSHNFQADIVAIGSSTGGPAALHAVLSNIKRPFPVPIVVVQHMPKLFIESLAKRLDCECELRCCVAEPDMVLQAGTVYFAPGESHMDIVRTAGKSLAVQLHQAAPEHHCRPAVDVTLRSLHALAPSVKTLVVILTGMGKDGAAGAKLLADAKARVIAQDKQSSVVWGMPGETVRLNAADEVLALNQIAAAISPATAGVTT
ncbi:MAG: CheB methylesterase domain-containing protein, partial [Mariprofundus sp.]